MSDRLLFRFDESVAGYTDTGRHLPCAETGKGALQKHRNRQRGCAYANILIRYNDRFGLNRY